MPSLVELQTREREIRDAGLRIYAVAVQEAETLAKAHGLTMAEALRIERDALGDAVALIERRMASERPAG